MSPKIETIAGDMTEKYNTYTYMAKRYNTAVKHEFYFEAMLIIYAMLEDRLRSFIYHAGFLDNRESKTLGNKKLKLFVSSLMEDYSGVPTDSKIKFDNISCKMDVVKALLKWAESEREPVTTFQNELKKQLRRVECNEFLSLLDELTDWLRYRNEVIHGLMNKKTEKVSEVLPELTTNGFKFVRFIDKQVGRIDKNDSIRSKRTLRK